MDMEKMKLVFRKTSIAISSELIKTIERERLRM